MTKCIIVANYFYFAWVYKLLNFSDFSSEYHANAFILLWFNEPYLNYLLTFVAENLKQKSEVKQYSGESKHLAQMTTTSGLFSYPGILFMSTFLSWENSFVDFYLNFEVTIAERQVSKAQRCLGSIVFNIFPSAHPLDKIITDIPFKKISLGDDPIKLTPQIDVGRVDVSYVAMLSH